MTHPSEETLNDYIERELSPAEHVQVATHLDTCRDCALVVAEIQQIVRDAVGAWSHHASASRVGAAAGTTGTGTVDSRQSSVDSR